MTKIANQNAAKLANQFKKALRLSSIIDAAMLADGIDPYRLAEQVAETIERAPDGQWRTMAISQGETPPGDETKALVIELYRARVRGMRLAPMLREISLTSKTTRERASLFDLA